MKRPWWRRWWAIAAYVLIVLLVGVRLALPYVLRRVIESQGEAFLAGKVKVANVDLWLLHGAVAIEGVELLGDRAIAATTAASAGGVQAAATATVQPAPSTDGTGEPTPATAPTAETLIGSGSA